jgi:Uma2 family endonuclease
MATVEQTRATLEDLYGVRGRAELIGGRIVRYMATGHKPNRAAGRIFRSLDDYADHVGRGEAYTDSIGFAIPILPSGRESFSPDASYYTGPLPENLMRFISGPPTFAAEVRSEHDYGEAAELRLALKRADYFAAGTQVVWDVDPLNESISVYRQGDPTNCTVYRRGQLAEAEPAVPGWTVAVDYIFGKSSKANGQ